MSAHKKIMTLLGLVMLLLGGCSGETVSFSQSPAAASEPETAIETAVPERGSIQDSSLTTQQQSLILDFFNTSYQSLAALQLQPLDDYFSNAEAAQSASLLLNYEIEVRKSQILDYHLDDYDFELEVVRVEEDEDGVTHIMLNENSVENFTALPGVDSCRYERFHWFVLSTDEQGQLLIEHYVHFSPIAMMLLQEGVDLEQTDQLSQILDELLQQLQASVSQLQTETEAVELPTVDHSYDSEQALAYARQYVNERNEAWQDYGRSGGNCQNYASQCLLAGGIPMDLEGSAVWKWYSDALYKDNTSRGRSSSWTGVDEFMQYAAANEGFGLAALSDAPWLSGQPGDLIHLGVLGEWRHTAMICERIVNEAGETVDYLVVSNTQNLQDYPVSLYGYTQFQLTRIAGWND